MKKIDGSDKTNATKNKKLMKKIDEMSQTRQMQQMTRNS